MRRIRKQGSRRNGPAGLERLHRVAALAMLGLFGLSLVWGAASTQPASRVAIVPIHGEINDILADSVQRRADQAVEDGADVIVFEMNTPGGMVTSALDICRYIKHLSSDVQTVAWVRHDAYSAGAMISVACQRIVMSSASAIGDCAPIMVSPGGGLQELPEAERAKIESPVLQEFRDSAARNGYDPLLCRAMVSVGVEVWWLEHNETGQREFVTNEEKERRIDEIEDTDQRQWKLVATYTDPVSGAEVRAKQPVDEANELLTVSQSEAVAYGLAERIIADEDELSAYLAAPGPLQRLSTTTWERFVIWLNSPLIRGILFAIVLVGAYVEFQNPGLIVPGAASALALVIFLGAPYAAGLADIWTIVLLVIGIILVAIEIFVIPGFGFVGLIGGVLILASFVGTFVPPEPTPGDGWFPPLFDWPTLDATWTALKTGIMVIASSIILAVVGLLLLARYLPQLPGGGLMPANPDVTTLLHDEPHADHALVGEIGVVIGPLKPSGQVRFGQEVVDVTSQGEYIETGRRVQVIKREGMTIIVRPLPEQA